VSFVAVTLCIASQRVFIVDVGFVIDSVRKLLGTPSCTDPVIVRPKVGAVLDHLHFESLLDERISRFSVFVLWS